MIFTTHDIDWISPLHPLSMVKTFTHGNKWISFDKIFQPNIFITQIRKLIDFNNQNNIESIWLTGAPSNHSYKRYGLRYTAGSKSYRKILDLLLACNCEIGLHSVSNEPFAKQFHTLHQLTQKPVNYHRSHYLKFNEKQLFDSLKRNGIKTDFSFGNARKVEIPVTPHITMGVNCVPTILFDNAFFFNKPDFVFNQFQDAMIEANKTNTDIAILFHPENFVVNPALWDYYAEISTIIKTSAATLNNKKTDN